MKNLDIKRMGKLLTFDITLNKKFYLQIAGIFAVVILLLSINNLVSWRHPSVNAGNIEGLVDFLSLTYFCTAGAVIVSNIQHKHKRIAEFMLPASKLEKFLARYIHIMIFIPLAAFVGIAVSDVLQMIFSEILIGDADSILATIFGGQLVDRVMVNGNLIIFDNITLFLFVNSLFLMVGTIFRRHAWIKSNIAIFAGLIVLMIAVVIVMKYSLDLIYGDGNYGLELLDVNGRRAVLYPIAIVLAAFNYWLGYRIYSRMQITTNRWYNL